MDSEREAPRADATAGTAEETVARLERQRARAYVERDVATLDRILPPDFVFTRSLGRALSKDELLVALASGELALEVYERHVRKVTVINNTAHAIGHDRVRGSYKGADISGTYHFSSVYVEQGGEWRVVAAHAYRLDDEDGDPAS
jgi:Domain of unknown function (DUF4440)